MKNILRRLSLLALCVCLLLLAVPAIGQEEEEIPLEEWQRLELQGLVEVVGAALQGQLLQAETPFETKFDFMKGEAGNSYVPFTLTIDPAKVSTSSVAMYLFIVEHSEAAADDTVAEDEEDEELPEPVFENGYFIDVNDEGEPDVPISISRAFIAPGGEYDVFIALRDSAGETAEEDEVADTSATIMMLKETVTIPNFWTSELMTSTIIVADEIEPMTQPPTAEEQLMNPYNLGTLRIVPKNDRSFGKRAEFSLIFVVYNPQLPDLPEEGQGQKPDVTIAYNFCKRTASDTDSEKPCLEYDEEGEENPKWFNNTNPQQFNAQTLPPTFDMTLGHQMVAGQSVPLALFPPGDYRLEITVTDNEAGSNVTESIDFTVRET